MSSAVAQTRHAGSDPRSLSASPGSAGSPIGPRRTVRGERELPSPTPGPTRPAAPRGTRRRRPIRPIRVRAPAAIRCRWTPGSPSVVPTGSRSDCAAARAASGANAPSDRPRHAVAIRNEPNHAIRCNRLPGPALRRHEFIHPGLVQNPPFQGNSLTLPQSRRGRSPCLGQPGARGDRNEPADHAGRAKRRNPSSSSQCPCTAPVSSSAGVRPCRSGRSLRSSTRWFR